MDFAEVTVVLGADGATGVFLDIGARENPGPAEGWQSFADVALDFRIAPRATGVVNADGLIGFVGAVKKLSPLERDFAEGDAEVFVKRALSIDLSRGGKSIGAVRFKRIFGGDHRFMQLKVVNS